MTQLGEPYEAIEQEQLHGFLQTGHSAKFRRQEQNGRAPMDEHLSTRETVKNTIELNSGARQAAGEVATPPSAASSTL